MKKLLFLALACVTVTALAQTTQILWDSEGFENFSLGAFVGQTDYNGNTVIVMPSNSDSGTGLAPEANENTIITDPTDSGNQVLQLKRFNIGNGGDRGSKVLLNWDGLWQQDKGLIKITGRVYPIGNGYAEIRLSNGNGARMARWCPLSSDYQGYLSHDGVVNVWAGAANKDNPNFTLTTQNGVRLVFERVTQAVWYNFELVLSRESNCLVSYRLWNDNYDKTIDNKHCNAFQWGAYQPMSLEFTCASNGYPTARDGAYFDDIVVTYELPDEPPFVTLIDDDMSSYNDGESLVGKNGYFQVSPNYAPGFEATITNVFRSVVLPGQVCYITLHNEEGGYPKAGLAYPLPAGFAGTPGARARITTTVFQPDNGTWGAAFFNEDEKELASFGYHSDYCNLLSVNTGGSLKHYDVMGTRFLANRWVVTVMDIENDAEGNAVINYAFSRNAYADYQKYGINFSQVVPGVTFESPTCVGVMEQAWGNDEGTLTPGRYLLLKDFKVEAVLPEPGLCAILAFLALGLLRKIR